jgi:hypothetical protein
MFRLITILGVVAAFFGTLYYGGDRLEAWESPQAAVEANEASGPKAKKKAKKKAKVKRRQATRKAKKRKATWLVELNAFCIRSLDETEAMEPPSRPEDIPRYIRRFEARNTRLNRQATEFVQRSGDAKTARAVRKLFDQEEQLVHSVLTAAQNGDEQGLRRSMRSLLAVGKSENKLFTRLGAVDCTLPPDAFELY